MTTELTANIPRKNLSNTFYEHDHRIEPPGNSVCLFLKATNLTTQTPFVFNISESGNQQAMWLRRGNSDQAWMTVDGNAGGTNEMPGIFFGPGGPSGARDVVLHRREADVLKTPDTMDVGALQIAGVDLDIDVGYLSATALHFEHLDALTADIELETEKTYVRVTAIGNGGLHNSNHNVEPTFTTAQTFTYAVEHTYGVLHGTASNFWKWVSIRIPETIDVGGIIYDTNFIDYRIRNRSTQADGREYYSLGNIEELGVAGGWRYGKIRSRIYENSVQHIDADTLQIRGTEFHGDIPDGAQITGGIIPPERLGTGTGDTKFLRRDSSWANAFDIHADVGTSAVIVDDDRIVFSDEHTSGDPMRHTTAAALAVYIQGELSGIPNTALSSAQGSTSLVPTGSTTVTTQIVTGHEYSSFPHRHWQRITTNNIDQLASRSSYVPLTTVDDNFPRWNVRTDGSATARSGTATIRWRYLSASNHPSVWVVVSDTDGSIVSMWEGEDPISVGDTVAPIGIPTIDDDDNPDTPDTTATGLSVVNVGLPSLSVIEAVYATLTATERADALSCTGDYVTGRGWLSAFTQLSDLATIEPRYEPSGRQWAMRCAAQAADEAVTTFYLGNLVVDAGVWAVAP